MVLENKKAYNTNPKKKHFSGLAQHRYVRVRWTQRRGLSCIN